MNLARQNHKRPWPVFARPTDRGAITAAEVLAKKAGPERDKAIDAWCASVWQAFDENHQLVANLLRERGIL
jgi:hypothetical protein